MKNCKLNEVEYKTMEQVAGNHRLLILFLFSSSLIPWLPAWNRVGEQCESYAPAGIQRAISGTRRKLFSVIALCVDLPQHYTFHGKLLFQILPYVVKFVESLKGSKIINVKIQYLVTYLFKDRIVKLVNA